METEWRVNEIQKARKRPWKWPGRKVDDNYPNSMRRGLIGRDSQSSVFDISFAGSAFRPATGIVRTKPPFLVSFVRTETFYSRAARSRSTQLGLSTIRISLHKDLCHSKKKARIF